MVRSAVLATASEVASVNGGAPDGAPAPGATLAPPAMEGFLPLVRTIARTMSHALPPVVELDDLVHDGVVGLLECARRFDPARGVDFRTYAGYRIRGAILDGLRTRDPLPRSVRQALKHLERDGAAPDGPGTPPRPFPPVTQLVSLEEAGPIAEARVEPEERLLAAELLGEVAQAMAGLAPRDRDVLHLRFDHGWRLREVAAHYGISITRVAELQERAIGRLRRALGVPGAADLSPNGRRRRRRGG